MLVAEALPALLLGIAARFYFPDTPHDAGWLSQQEIAALETVAASNLRTRVENDSACAASPAGVGRSHALVLSAIGSYGLIFWLPQVSKSLSGLSTQAIGWVNALPWLGAAIGMGWDAAHSDRTGERIGHVALPAAFAALAVLLARSSRAVLPRCAHFWYWARDSAAAQGAFWALPTALLTPRTLAVAAVAINLLGSAGGLAMPHLIGYTLDAGGGYGGVSLLIQVAHAGVCPYARHAPMANGIRGAGARSVPFTRQLNRYVPIHDRIAILRAAAQLRIVGPPGRADSNIASRELPVSRELCRVLHGYAVFQRVRGDQPDALDYPRLLREHQWRGVQPHVVSHIDSLDHESVALPVSSRAAETSGQRASLGGQFRPSVKMWRTALSIRIQVSRGVITNSY